MKRHCGKLDRKPRAGSVTGLIFYKRFAFIEKKYGFTDRKENQLCNLEEGQTTPYVVARYKSLDNYVNNTYLLAEKVIEKDIKEADKLIAELNLLQNYKENEIEGNEEEVSRALRLAQEKASKNAKRIEEIVVNLSEIRAFLEAVDEKLRHHIEAAEDLLSIHIANYWRGILKGSKGGETNIEPMHIAKAYVGRQQYAEDHEDIVRKISEAIEMGGGIHEE